MKIVKFIVILSQKLFFFPLILALKLHEIIFLLVFEVEILFSFLFCLKLVKTKKVLKNI